MRDSVERDLPARPVHVFNQRRSTSGGRCPCAGAGIGCMHSPRIFQEDRRETYSTEAAKTRSICAPLFWKTKVRKSSLFQSKDEPEGSEGYPPSLFPYLHCSWTGESRPTMEERRVGKECRCRWS